MEEIISGKTLELYLVDGNPNGIITAEVFNWTGHVLITSRASGQIKKVLKRDEAKRTGVYILLGEIKGNETAYIGEADEIGNRLREHHDKKDWWEKAVLITTITNNLNKAHVKYLEARLIKTAGEAGNVSLDNKKNSFLPNLSESHTANMKEFLDKLLMVLSTLHIEIFVNKKRPKKQESKKKLAGTKSTSSVNPIFVLKDQGNDYNAEMVIEGSDFIILAESRVFGEWRGDDFGSDAKEIKNLKKKGILRSDDGKNFQFTENYAFQSASKAAKIVVGRNVNGLVMWRVKDSKQTLKQWESKQLKGDLMKVFGNAIIKQAKTGKNYKITSDMLDFQEIDRYERTGMGIEKIHSALLHHPELGEFEWKVWEHPENAYNHHEFPVGPHKMIKNNFRFIFIDDPENKV